VPAQEGRSPAVEQRESAANGSKTAAPRAGGGKDGFVSHGDPAAAALESMIDRCALEVARIVYNSFVQSTIPKVRR
jgi:hypothetical protein